MKAKFVRNFLFEISQEEENANKEIEKWNKKTGKIKSKSFEETLFSFLNDRQKEDYMEHVSHANDFGDVIQDVQEELEDTDLDDFLKNNPEVKNFKLFDQHEFAEIGLGDSHDWYGNIEPKMLDEFDFKPITDNHEILYDKYSKVGIWKQFAHTKYYWLWFFKIDSKFSDKHTVKEVNNLLIKACQEGDIEGVKEAIKNGAKVDYDYGQPLYHATVNNHAEIVKILLKSNALDNIYESFLWACQNNCLDAVKIYVDYGIEALPRTSEILPTSKAARGGALETLNYLINEKFPLDHWGLWATITQVFWDEESKGYSPGTALNIVKLYLNHNIIPNNEDIESAKKIARNLKQPKFMEEAIKLLSNNQKG